MAAVDLDQAENAEAPQVAQLPPLSLADGGVAQIDAYFVNLATFKRGVTPLGQGAVKHVYRVSRTNLVLCIPKNVAHKDSVEREHAKFEYLKDKDITIARVSDLFPAPCVDDLKSRVSPLNCSGIGFLEELIVGIPVKPMQGVATAPVTTQTMAVTLGSSALIKASISNGVWGHPDRLSILILDIVKIIACHDGRHISLVDLQGFLKADGHFVLADPPTGDPGNAANVKNRTKLKNLITVLDIQRRKLLPS
jgi:hypothetical protein